LLISLIALFEILISSFFNIVKNPILSESKKSVLFVLAFITFEKRPRPAVNKQEATQPSEALGQTLIPNEFWLKGDKYKIKVLREFSGRFTVCSSLA